MALGLHPSNIKQVVVMGLILTRKIGEKIIINGDIILEVVGTGRNVKLDFTFPKSSSVIREELLTQARENGTESELYLKGILK